MNKLQKTLFGLTIALIPISNLQATEYPLHKAVVKGNIQEVRRLLDNGEHINRKHNKQLKFTPSTSVASILK